MSMAKCKCGVIFDTDIHLETDESGNCCCDNCFEEIMVSFEEDIEKNMKINPFMFDPSKSVII